MSTRATYQFCINTWSEQAIYYYVQHDNYPEGVAHYFLLMHEYKNLRSGYAGCFFRAVENAEFTEGHELHGDTQYRYNLTRKGILIALARDFHKETWEQIYNGPWYDFVNQQLKELTLEERLYSFKTSEYSNYKTVMTLIEADAFIKTKLTYVDESRQYGSRTNADYVEGEAKLVQRQVDDLRENGLAIQGGMSHE